MNNPGYKGAPWAAWLCAMLLAGAMQGWTSRAAWAVPVELELVLAVDCSSSVSSGEIVLQMQGIADALAHPSVVAAIEATAPKGIAITVVQWSSKANQVQVVDWHHAYDADSTLAIADRIYETARIVGGGSTAIGSVIEFAARLLETNAFEGKRRTIDISGDGVSNQGPLPDESRRLAAALGITINGLAILNESPRLDHYYRTQVVAGPAAFVVSAEDSKDFSQAMLRKLLIEITGPPVASNPPRPSQPRQAAIQRSSPD